MRRRSASLKIISIFFCLTMFSFIGLSFCGDSGDVTIETTAVRKNFLRMEKDAFIGIEIINGRDVPLKHGKLKISFEGHAAENISVSEIAPGGRYETRCKVNTRLRQGKYELKASLAYGNSGLLSQELTVPVQIVERPLPRRMPVIMWGPGPVELLKEYGFTHMVFHVQKGWPEALKFYTALWNKGEPLAEVSNDVLKAFDDALAQKFNFAVYPYPASIAVENKKFNRIDREGKPKEGYNACGLFEEMQKFCYNAGVSFAMALEKFPAWDSALIQSEVRDQTSPCFHEHDRKAFKEYSGYDIPAEIEKARGVDYKKLPDFPLNRIISDKNPILTYYRWFWKEGDGWNNLFTQIHNGLKSTGRSDIWTWFDPAVRAPSIYGSGGGVDVISQWTYAAPDPEKTGFATDELFAMARGAKNEQNVMKMTQIIWRRWYYAPLSVKKDYQAQWEIDQPNERIFITIPPDSLKIAFWSKISRPIKGIMYFGLQSLFDVGDTADFKYTNPETKVALKELTEKIVKPLGPVLVQLPDPETNAAFLESFTSQIFAGRGTSGWSDGWEADAYLILRYAQIQPRVIYEETILKEGLEGYKILFLMNCDVLTESIAKKIEEFRKKGGIVIGDENLAPGIRADITMDSFKRTYKGAADKEVLLEKARRLRNSIDKHFNRMADSDNPDILTRVRRYGTAEYLFAYNDARQYGNYIGHREVVMEEGVSSKANLSLRRNGGYVYDLVRSMEVKAETEGDWMKIGQDFEAAEGKLFMITERPVRNVKIDVSDSAVRGGRVKAVITVADDRGMALDAVVPVRVEIIDPRQEAMEFSGYYGAKDGKVEIQMDIAENDEPGEWTLKAKELASGIIAEQNFKVE